MSEAIDNSLSDLGLFVKETLYDRLKNKYNISPEDIGKRVTDFSNEIEGIFGLGAKRLENLIIKKLNKRTRLNRVLGTWLPEVSFPEYIQMAREEYIKNRKN